MARIASPITYWVFLAAVLALATAARASAQEPVAAAEPHSAESQEEEQPINGFNFSLNFTAEHNSSTGWTNTLSPDLSFRFKRHYSFHAVVPWYLSVNDYEPRTVKGVTSNVLEGTTSILADMAILGGYEVAHNNFNYVATATMGLPTGNNRFGLTANQVSYNFTNHFDYNFKHFNPDIEIGEGDSSNLTDQQVKKSYTDVGQMANFQAGFSVDLLLGATLDLEAYEDLPIGDQKVYGTVTTKNKKGKTISTQVLEGTGAAEDNGFTAELDVPLGGHVVLAGVYERSLIQALDTASVGITWTLRKPKAAGHTSK
jgi:hypothetical protein